MPHFKEQTELMDEVEEVMRQSLVCILTFTNEKGEPVSHPMLPLYDKELKRLYFTSSVLFSKKLEDIKRNGNVSVLFQGRSFVKAEKYHAVTLKGSARVEDEEFSERWMRLLPLWREKEPYIDAYLKRRVALPLFWERAVIEITPREYVVWVDGDLSRPPVTIRVS
ncbi:MAG: pyridoxamine 5'-phosphate oxidase family protein [Aigarchaeota archaeon]|nr:pyridoxamine 5'-phosphate oxidase family protein [Aigarchaeota archaeon]MDW8092387.1 pyridoxamine 5'-phosphate oxidase family protein [Nitrososphaerota archaeon]